MQEGCGYGGHGFDAGGEGGVGERFEAAGVKAGEGLALGFGCCQLGGIHGAEAEIDERDFLVEGEDADVFAAHHLLHGNDVRDAEGLDEGGLDVGGEGGVVDLDGGGFVFEDSYGGGLVGGQAGGGCEAGGHLLETGDDGLAGLGGEGAGGEFELDAVGDDVAAGATVDGADGDDGGVLGIFFAADDGLDLRDEEGGEGDGVAAELGCGAVAADAVDDDVDGGGGGHGGAGEDAYFADGEGVDVVEADDVVGAAEALVEVVGEEGLGAVDGFFGGLADEHEGSMPLRFGGGQGAGGADEDGGVDVVAAGVHDADFLAGCVGDGDVAGVGEAGLFDDGKGVHVGADEEGGAGPVLEEGDDTEGVGAVGVEADVVGDGVAGVAEILGEDGGGALFVVGEFGVGVEVFVDFDEGGLGEGGSGGEERDGG